MCYSYSKYRIKDTVRLSTNSMRFCFEMVQAANNLLISSNWVGWSNVLHFDKCYDQMTSNYCKSGNFRENFNFANSVKIHFYDAKNRNKGMIYLYQ